MKPYQLIVFLLLAISCSKKIIAPVVPIVVPPKINLITAEKVFNAYQLKLNNYVSEPTMFSSNIETTIKGNNVNLNADIYLVPNKLIWVNLFYLGFSVGKILITESKIEGYEKLSKTYFSEQIVDLKKKYKLNNSEISIESLQNILQGKLFLKSNPEDFSCIKNEESYLLTRNKLSTDLLYFKKVKFDLFYKPVEINLNNNSNLKIDLNYEWNEVGDLKSPKTVIINSLNPKINTIKINYKKSEIITFNPPFKIPTNYTKRQL